MNEIFKRVESKIETKMFEKKAFGEVFTPVETIDKLLGGLPAEVWTNPKLRWLDPSAGIGNFSILVYYKLMVSLKEKIPPEKLRSKHIIEKMLFMVELNTSNCEEARSIFKDINKKSKPNIYNEDYLKWSSFREEKYDIIMSNPPYNTSRLHLEKHWTTAGRVVIWDKFVKNSFNILKHNGYLCFITPANWRRPLHPLWDLMSNKQILYLNIFGLKDGLKIFKCGTRFDLYVIENIQRYKHTNVIDENGESHNIHLSKWDFLPSYNFDIIDKIRTNQEDGMSVIHGYGLYTTDKNRDVVRFEKNDVYKYPVVHGITKNGIKYVWAKNNAGHFGVPKVLLNFNQVQYSYPEQNDFDGKYGCSCISFGLVIKSREEGDEILRAINTDIFRDIIKSTKWGPFQTDFRMFKFFKKDWYKIVLAEENRKN